MSENLGFMRSRRWALREQTPVTTVESKRTRSYFDLQDVQKEDGFRREELIEHDYPITPEYVTSFADGADYHADPVGAVARGNGGRTNLGDIRHIQAAMGLDAEHARAIYEETMRVNQILSQRLSDAKAGKVQNKEESEVK